MVATQLQALPPPITPLSSTYHSPPLSPPPLLAKFLLYEPGHACHLYISIPKFPFVSRGLALVLEPNSLVRWGGPGPGPGPVMDMTMGRH